LEVFLLKRDYPLILFKACTEFWQVFCSEKGTVGSSGVPSLVVLWKKKVDYRLSPIKFGSDLSLKKFVSEESFIVMIFYVPSPIGVAKEHSSAM
jgi:hypothetical protein